jgi:hypothetical protein
LTNALSALSCWRVEAWLARGARHEAAYAGLRLAERLLAEGRRQDAGLELEGAHAAAAGHVPLRGAIEHLARRAWPPVPSNETLRPHDLGEE